MPEVPVEPPERYVPLEEADGERVTVTGYISTFSDPAEEQAQTKPPFGFGTPTVQESERTQARNRHHNTVRRTQR